MEFYGSIDSVSGSITASLFTGSFKGDGGGLYNLAASGVTGLNLSQIASGNATASISSTGFTVNKNTQIQGDLSVTGSIIATNYIVSSSVTYMTTSFASGSSMFGNDGNDVHQFTGSVQITGSITLNGQAIGTGKLDETTFQSYTSSISSSIGSLSSSIALTDVSQSNRLTTIEGNYATTGSNLFKGSQTISGSIIPSVDNTYDLGSTTHQWRDVYISSGSLYIDGTKVLGSTSQELTITTDTGQSIKILEAGSDSIILQSADGDIELKSSGGGDILFDPTNGIISIKGTTQIQDGFKITSSGGNSIVFGDAVIVSGSIDLTGNVDGIDLQSFSSSVSASISSLLGGNTSLSSSIATTTSGLTSTITSVSSSLTSSIGSLSSSLATITNGLSSSIGSLSSSVATTTSGLSSSIGSLSSSVATTTFSLSSSIESLSSSVATTTSGLTSTITSLSSSLTSSIGSISSSINSTIGSLSSSVSTSIGGLSSSVATTTSELSSSIGSLSSSIATTTIGAKNRVDSIETTTGSLNTFSSSINTTIKSKLDSESIISGSVQIIITGTTGYSTFSSSVSTSIGELSSSVSITTSGLTSTITSLSSSLTSSIGSLSSSIATTTSGLSSSIGSLSSSIATTTSELSSSIGSLSSSVATTTSGLSSSIGSLSSSVATTTSGLSSSIATTTLGIKNRVDSIDAKTGSYATTGSNIFQGNQTITGSLYITQDLIVAGSSSIQNISSSILNIGDNIITVNALNPSVRFGGLAVIDSGSSPQVSGSMLFDSVNDQWIFIHQNQSSVTSSILLMGPQTYDNIGNEAFPTNNRLLKSVNAEHLGDSNITDNGTKVSINSNTEITGSLIVTGDKITVNAVGGDEGGEILLGKAVTNTTLSGNGVTIDVWQNRLRFFEQGGNARGAFLDISTLANGVGTNLLGTAATASYVEYSNVANKPTLVSGSSQVSFNGITDKPTLVSGSSQITFSGISGLPTLISGSSQIDLTGTTNYASGILTRLNVVGVFSGSSQVTHDSTTGYVANRHIDHTAVSISAGNGLSGGGDISTTRTLTLDTGSVHFLDGVKKELNTEGVVSGSSQVLNGTTIHSGSFFNGISVVSGSAQISFNGITDKPTLISGSSQITYSGISSIPSGIVSGSSQIDLTGTTNYASGILTRLNAVGVFSGSAQVTLSSTTGYGSVLNQAVLTSSSPTFAGLTNNGTYTQATTSTQPLTINGDSGDTNGLFRIQIDSVSDSFASGARTYLGDGGIDIFLGTSNSSYTPSNTYIALNHSGEISMGAGSANKHFTLSTSGNLTISGTIGASNFSGSSSGTNTGDQTLNSLGALSNAADSEQDVGTRNLYYNDGVKRVSSDPRWNESGYDTDLGTLHIYSTTAAGANYGRAGIALYNGSAYQYLTTKASTTGLFANNSLILTAGNYTSYAMAGAGYSANQNLSTSSTVQFGSLGVGVSPSLTVHFRGSNEMVRFENTSTSADQYCQLNMRAGSRNGYIWVGNQNTSAWAGDGGLNIYTDFGNMDLWSNAVQRVRLQSDGHLRPFANNTYDLGTASFGWRNVYTNDLHLSNMGKPEGNDVDGTNGNWTIQEGSENLYIINNNNGKKFKISLEEII